MPAQTNRLYNYVAFLTALRPARNYQNVVSLEKAAQYIEEELSKAGATP